MVNTMQPEVQLDHLAFKSFVQNSFEYDLQRSSKFWSTRSEVTGHMRKRTQLPEPIVELLVDFIFSHSYPQLRQGLRMQMHQDYLVGQTICKQHGFISNVPSYEHWLGWFEVGGIIWEYPMPPQFLWNCFEYQLHGQADHPILC